MTDLPRCPWARSALSIRYHDEEWGTPSRDDRHLFELLILEGAQAGLSWDTVLAKRENYRRAFHDFDADRVARITPARLEKLMADPGLIRNRAKLESAVVNARAVLALRDEGLTLSKHLWSFVGNAPIVRRPGSLAEVPPTTPESVAMSRDLRRRGFKFIGPTICYALMQAAGLADDHVASCFRAAPAPGARKPTRPKPKNKIRA